MAIVDNTVYVRTNLYSSTSVIIWMFVMQK